MVSAIGKGRQGVEHVSGSSWEKNTKAECWRGPRKQCLKKKKKKKKKMVPTGQSNRARKRDCRRQCHQPAGPWM